jgi:ectoine hydroxylase-related dioxygenase (phytanoyl-CoA dioxygenase family)
MIDEFETTGRVWFRGAVSESALISLESALDLSGRPGVRMPVDRTPKALLAEVSKLVSELAPGARAVRVVAFEKNDAGNWALPWHQDRVVALQTRVDAPGFANWSRKSGAWHAEPPSALLERMVFARVHLDPSRLDNGCLQVALGTHRQGRILASNADGVAGGARIEDCIADRGDVLLAKALILHRSSATITKCSRRALRIDYCAESLPEPLAWAS